MSSEAKDLLQAVITPEVEKRVDIQGIKDHVWYSTSTKGEKVQIDWSVPLIKQTPPFIPQLSNDLDSKYLDDRRRPNEVNMPVMTHLPKNPTLPNQHGRELTTPWDPIDSLLDMEEDDDFDGFSVILTERDNAFGDEYLKSMSELTDYDEVDNTI